eukprot:CAMPEP_0185707174 /NCGR_PEP_ID=MMETSP1164-20130828/23485_1 /TAXON_ID=1104430 /ORGANISM="Chrysoreinhardia sp, Strain CCMP2950" /LENGTH=82 /DNA_ID=CAMNT_0028374599 /DNA_START=131 /DNA_END=376 /DNA_ORIENTATION=-
MIIFPSTQEEYEGRELSSRQMLTSCLGSEVVLVDELEAGVDVEAEGARERAHRVGAEPAEVGEGGAAVLGGRRATAIDERSE